MRKTIPSTVGFEEGVSYRVIAQAPPPTAAETDDEGSVVEVLIAWGDDSVLHVAHVPEGASFWIGEPSTKRAADAPELIPDFVMGAEVLGSARWPLVVAREQDTYVVVPRGSACTLSDAERTLDTQALLDAGLLGESHEGHEEHEGHEGHEAHKAHGACELRLPPGATLDVQHGGFRFMLRKIPAGKRLGVGLSSVEITQPQRHTWTLASFSGHALLFVFMYFLPPSSPTLSVDALSTHPRYASYLTTPTSIDDIELPDSLQPKQDGSTPGKQHADDSGAMGDDTAPRTNKVYARKGPKDNPTPELTREQARERAADDGIIGLLKAQVGQWNTPTSPFGRAQAEGREAQDALGAILGNVIGNSHGFAGLGPIGSGRGGGGDGRGTVGVGDVGTVGRAGDGGSGYGAPSQGLRGHTARVPKITGNKPEVLGALSKETIRRVISRQLSAVRHCYTQALNARPDLQGRVAVKFVIAPSGAVQRAIVASSDLADAQAAQCIAGVVERLTFPSPDGGGLVVVTYPFVLQQTGN